MDSHPTDELSLAKMICVSRCRICSDVVARALDTSRADGAREAQGQTLKDVMYLLFRDGRDWQERCDDVAAYCSSLKV